MRDAEVDALGRCECAVAQEAVERRVRARPHGRRRASSSAAGSEALGDGAARVAVASATRARALMSIASRGSSAGSRASSAPSARRSRGASRRGARRRPAPAARERAAGAGAAGAGAPAARSTSSRVTAPPARCRARPRGRRRAPRAARRASGETARPVRRGRGGRRREAATEPAAARWRARGRGRRRGPPRRVTVASGVPTGTLRPHRHEQLARSTPSSKISTSISALSVSTTATMSPRCDGVAGLHAPLEQRARLHVGAERRHPEVSS